MATYTTNYHLEKPAQSDLYNIDVFNGNADTIDTTLASKSGSSNIATVESSNTASKAYAKGEYLVYNGLLYIVTTAIASGGTITPGTNVTQTNVGTEITPVEIKQTDVTIAENVTVSRFKCWKVMGFVWILAVISTSATFTSSDNLISGLPSADSLTDLVGSSNNGATTVANVRSNGALRFGGSQPAGSYFFSGIYKT